MHSIALKLSDADRAKVAAYYAAPRAPARSRYTRCGGGAILYLRGDTARASRALRKLSRRGTAAATSANTAACWPACALSRGAACRTWRARQAEQ